MLGFSIANWSKKTGNRAGFGWSDCYEFPRTEWIQAKEANRIRTTAGRGLSLPEATDRLPISPEKELLHQLSQLSRHNYSPPATLRPLSGR